MNILANSASGCISLLHGGLTKRQRERRVQFGPFLRDGLGFRVSGLGFRV